MHMNMSPRKALTENVGACEMFEGPPDVPFGRRAMCGGQLSLVGIS
jgi:hypothetical protein